MQTIALFGASGGTGKPLTELALKEGYTVQALVRTPAKLSLTHPNLQIIQGDVTDPAKVEATIRGASAVLNVIGAAKGSPADLKSSATRHIIAAMSKLGVRRFIRIASAPFGVLDDGEQPTLGQRLMSSLIKALMSAQVTDELHSVDLIRQSALDWTVVRAPMLSNDPPLGHYRVGAAAGKSITRADVAAFMLDELKQGQFVRKLPLVSN